MGRATVRAAIASYLTSKGSSSIGGDDSVPLLVGVVAHPAKQTLDEDWANVSDTNIESIAGDGTTASVETTSPHGLSSGMVVAIIGNEESGFNITNATITVVDAQHFTFPSTVEGEGSGGYVEANWDSGAVLFMYLGPAKRGRFAFGGQHDGLKYSTYELTLNVYLRSQSDLAEDADADNDTLIDDLIAAIEADRTAGTDESGDGTGAVWQWGEGPWNSRVDIATESTYPQLLSEGLSTTQVYTEVTIAVIEIIRT